MLAQAILHRALDPRTVSIKPYDLLKSRALQRLLTHPLVIDSDLFAQRVPCEQHVGALQCPGECNLPQAKH